jgi:hypothetical protein
MVVGARCGGCGVVESVYMDNIPSRNETMVFLILLSFASLVGLLWGDSGFEMLWLIRSS